jgi:hypothetical protein
MSNTHLTPSPDEIPAVDTAESAEGHPHTQGFEQDDAAAPRDEADTEFGESPDVETHTTEGLGAVNPGV